MTEAQLERTKPAQGASHLLKLTCAAILILIVYAAGLAPAFKLCFDHPRFGATFGPLFEVIYDPLITQMSRHPYGYVDRFYFWYGTEVWKIPMVRN
jgi:hypothetical protein